MSTDGSSRSSSAEAALPSSSSWLQVNDTDEPPAATLQRPRSDSTHSSVSIPSDDLRPPSTTAVGDDDEAAGHQDATAPPPVLPLHSSDVDSLLLEHSYVHTATASHLLDSTLQENADEASAGATAQPAATDGFVMPPPPSYDDAQPKKISSHPDDEFLQILVAGEAGLGKSTFIRTLFALEACADEVAPTREIAPITQSIPLKSLSSAQQGGNMHLTWVDTPGYGDSVNVDKDSIKPVIQHLEKLFGETNHAFRPEASPDTIRPLICNGHEAKKHIDLCFFFIQAHRIKEIDVAFMKALSPFVPIVPVIAKADTMTVQELQSFRKTIQQKMHENNINMFNFGQQIDDRPPFAVVGSRTKSETKHGPQFAREYPWGTCIVEDPSHSDVSVVRRMLLYEHLKTVHLESAQRFLEWRQRLLDQDMRRKADEARAERQRVAEAERKLAEERAAQAAAAAAENGRLTVMEKRLADQARVHRVAQRRLMINMAMVAIVAVLAALYAPLMSEYVTYARMLLFAEQFPQSPRFAPSSEPTQRLNAYLSVANGTGLTTPWEWLADTAAFKQPKQHFEVHTFCGTQPCTAGGQRDSVHVQFSSNQQQLKVLYEIRDLENGVYAVDYQLAEKPQGPLRIGVWLDMSQIRESPYERPAPRVRRITVGGDGLKGNPLPETAAKVTWTFELKELETTYSGTKAVPILPDGSAESPVKVSVNINGVKYPQTVNLRDWSVTHVPLTREPFELIVEDVVTGKPVEGSPFMVQRLSSDSSHGYRAYFYDTFKWTFE